MNDQTENTFVIRRFNGTEIYRVQIATLSDYRDADGSTRRAVLEAICDEKAIQTLPDTEELQAEPNIEVIVPFEKSLDPDKLVGKTYTLPDPADMDDARVYYVEHDVLKQGVVTFMLREEDRFHVRITGKVTDVNYYDGSKPDAAIEVDAWFALDVQID